MVYSGQKWKAFKLVFNECEIVGDIYQLNILVGYHYHKEQIKMDNGPPPLPPPQPHCRRGSGVPKVLYRGMPSCFTT
jgi:hypothetical protein